MEYFLHTPFDVDKLSIFSGSFHCAGAEKKGHITESLPDFFQQLGLKSWLKL